MIKMMIIMMMSMMRRMRKGRGWSGAALLLQFATCWTLLYRRTILLTFSRMMTMIVILVMIIATIMIKIMILVMMVMMMAVWKILSHYSGKMSENLILPLCIAR